MCRYLRATALDFSRYGDTLFEVLFAGGRLAAGGNVVEEGKKLDTNARAHFTQPNQLQFSTCSQPTFKAHAQSSCLQALRNLQAVHTTVLMQFSCRVLLGLGYNWMACY